MMTANAQTQRGRVIDEHMLQLKMIITHSWKMEIELFYGERRMIHNAVE